jgi:hypothetical protein
MAIMGLLAPAAPVNCGGAEATGDEGADTGVDAGGAGGAEVTGLEVGGV